MSFCNLKKISDLAAIQLIQKIMQFLFLISNFVSQRDHYILEKFMLFFSNIYKLQTALASNHLILIFFPSS